MTLLRKTIGMSQTTFAVEVLQMAISTVARYETSTPPTGEFLLRLADIADQYAVSRPGGDTKRLVQIRDTFRSLYLEEVYEKLGTEYVSCCAQDVPCGFLFLRLTGRQELAAAGTFLTNLQDQRSLAKKVPA